MAETMDFFRAQDEARGRTFRLVALLTLAVIVLVGSLYVIAVLAQAKAYGLAEPDWRQPRLFLGTSGLALAVIVGGSLMRIAELSRGGGAVAERLGGRLVAAGTSRPEERRYLNVVEEMALASGLPVPLCYVIDGDRTINAFAAGNTPQDAAIGVTEGALAHLTREELQGVIAHEFSHIGNGDMRLNLRIIGTVAGLTALSQLGYLVVRGISHMPRSNRRDGGPALLLAAMVAGFVVLVIGLGGVFFARLIQASVSRQREYLADASAVQFTRNPVGFASALRKVAGLAGRDRQASAAELESQHLFFASSGGFLEFLFSSHPPIAERIRRVDPAAVDEAPAARGAGSASRWGAAVSGLAGSASVDHVVAPRPAPTDLQIQSALAYPGQLPEPLRQLAGEPVGAMGLVVGLLLRPDGPAREAQLARAAALAAGEVAKAARAVEASLRALPAGSRLPLLDLCLPSLRQLSPDQQAAFRSAIERASGDADDGLLVLLIRSMLRRQLGAPSVAPGGNLASACALVLSAVVQTSGEDTAAQARAYARGHAALAMDGVGSALRPAEEVDLPAVETAFATIAAEGVPLRRRLVRACGVAMLSDGRARPAEIEMVRAVAESLGIVFTPPAR